MNNKSGSFLPAVVLCASLWLCCHRAHTQDVPELLYYKFNDSTAASTVNFAIPGAGLNPAPVLGLSMTGPGQFGKALVGTGGSSSTDYVNTGWLFNLASHSWTLSLWLNNIPSDPTTYWLFGDNTSVLQFRSFVGGAAGAGNIILRADGMTDVVVPGIAPGPTVVHFVYDSAASHIRAYKNGIPVTTVPQTLALAAGAAPFKVGGYSTNAGLPPAALLDEFRLYSRALDSIEVAQTWNHQLLSTGVALSRPNGGEYFIVGTPEDILWTNGGGVITVDIEFSFDNGANWNLIVSSYPAATGHYAWMVPNTPTAQAFVRIKSTDDPALADTSDAPFSISASGAHDIGISALGQAALFSHDRSVHSMDEPSTRGQGDAEENTWQETDTQTERVTTIPRAIVFSTDDDTVTLEAVVRNFGTFPETSYTVGWSIDGTPQPSVANSSVLEVTDTDTVRLVWPNATNAIHTARAWSILATDANSANDTSAPFTFQVGRVQGDTICTFTIPGQLILGVARLGSSNKLLFSSGGQEHGTTIDDNKWIVTDLYGSVLDTTHAQIANTPNEGYGFRDLAWDGNWILASDNNQIRRIDTASFTEVLPRITTTVQTLCRGVAVSAPNQIWTANFQFGPVAIIDTNGTLVRSYGIPPVRPYGLATDKWTTPGRMWLWYTEPSSTTQPRRLSKVDTSNGAIVATFDYSSITSLGNVNGGLDIINDHPDFPGRVVAFMVIQAFPNSRVLVIDLGVDSTVTAVEPTVSGTPSSFATLQNYPNPFNSSTNIGFTIQVSGFTSLRVYDVLGREVEILLNDIQDAGFRWVRWDASRVSSGVYFCRLSTDRFVQTRKLVLLR